MDIEAQEDELLALSSIFADNFEITNEGNIDAQSSIKGGLVKIYVELPHPFYIHYVRENQVQEKHFIEFLPPLYLHFKFPCNYPSELPPDYKLYSQWLNKSKLLELHKHLDSIWLKNTFSEVMFSWVQFLKDKTLSSLNISNFLEVNEELSEDYLKDGANCHEVPSTDVKYGLNTFGSTSLFQMLKNFDEKARENVFNSKVFTCKVCFSEHAGYSCIKFWPCSHVYCNACMKTYFEVQIKEGNVKGLTCPNDLCDSEANPKQIEKLVAEDLYQRWDEMLLNSTLSSLGDIQPCPRLHCQYPVTVEENQGNCPSCGFVFCAFCRMSWHGLEKCRMNSNDVRGILKAYSEGDKCSQAKLENRYGKKYLTQLLQESLSYDYISSNAKECPKCSSNIEKIDGCNKMHCGQCGCHFCWLCQQILDKTHPYAHFNNPGSICYNKLFQGVDHDIWDFFDHESDEDE